MSDIKLIALGNADPRWLQFLLDKEEFAWHDELDWDYAPIREVLASYMARNLLPGYVAISNGQPAAYGYFLISQYRGIIGTVYAPPSAVQQEVADEIITHSVRELRSSERIGRIESQILPFHSLAITGTFARHGFQSYVRYFMEMSLSGFQRRRGVPPRCHVISWNSALLSQAARIVQEGYKDQADALLSEEYRSIPGCEGYLRSLVEGPGCGTFLPDASFMAIDDSGRVCGFILSSRISASAGMIPQVAIAPSHQGLGVGNLLISRALSRIALMRMSRVSLTVTKKNCRAFDWYCRLGFKIRKEFAAFVWEKSLQPDIPRPPSN